MDLKKPLTYDEQLNTLESHGMIISDREKAEVYYRTQIAYVFSTAKCTEAPYDQHYDEKNFYNKKCPSKSS